MAPTDPPPSPRPSDLARNGTDDGADGDDAPLPSLDDMRDTLMFVWSYFFDRMIEARIAAPERDFTTEWNGAAIAMRHRAVADPAGNGPEPAATLDFVELTIADRAGAFTTRATFLAARDGTPPPPVAWSGDGDHETFVAWMIPWVAQHVAEGGGWIELP